jgi:NitT/TauT family transport system permease protein
MSRASAMHSINSGFIVTPEPSVANPTVEPAPMRKSPAARNRAWIYPVLGVALPLLLWETLVYVLSIPEYLLPSPTKMLLAALTPERAAYLWPQALSTSVVVVVGFLVAAVAATLLAVGSLYSRGLELALMPLLVGSQVVPKVAFAPLVVIWFGISLSSKVIMVVLIAFFPMVLSTLLGFRSVSSDHLLVVRSMGATRLQELFRVRIPAALPQMFGGFKVAMTLSMIGAIVAEFVASDEGLGHVLIMDQASIATLLVFTDLLWLIGVGFVLYGAVSLLERIVLGRRSRQLIESGAR